MKKIVRDFIGVAIRFWRPSKIDCESAHYKPLFAEACVQNKNPDLLCASVNMKEYPEIAAHFNAHELCQFNFFFKGKEYSKVEGFNVG